MKAVNTTQTAFTSGVDFEAHAGGKQVLTEAINASGYLTAMYFGDKAEDLKVYKLDQLDALTRLQLGEDLNEHSAQIITFLVKDLVSQIKALNQVQKPSLDTIASQGGAA